MKIKEIESETFMINTHVAKENINERRGIVIILDALGVKNFDTETSKQFILDFHQIVGLVGGYEKMLKKIYLVNEQAQFEVFMFQDTLILTLDVPDEKSLLNYLQFTNDWLSKFFITALNLKIYFRGAISYGNFIEYNKHFYLGEAVRDAAQWYEEADWLGIIYTPNIGKYLFESMSYIRQGILQNEQIDTLGSRFELNFIYYNVPVKNGKTCTLWCVNWVTSLFATGSLPELEINKRSNSLSYYYSLMKFADIPKGSENKYNNTLVFVESVHRTFPELNNIPRPN